MSALPRTKPKCFADLSMQVAIIRPGPVTGKFVNPYIERRLGRQPITYLHPLFEPFLHRTLGVLDSLLKIPANFIVCTEWTPLPMSKARKEVNKRRRHFNMSKTAFVSQMGNDVTKTNPRDVLVDESKQADIENLGDCLASRFKTSQPRLTIRI